MLGNCGTLNVCEILGREAHGTTASLPSDTAGGVPYGSMAQRRSDPPVPPPRRPAHSCSSGGPAGQPAAGLQEATSLSTAAGSLAAQTTSSTLVLWPLSPAASSPVTQSCN